MHSHVALRSCKLGGLPIEVLMLRSAELRRSINNIPWVDALPQEGANVYSILQRDYLAITEAALQRLIIRLRTPINR
eukprot:scaffold256515_cov37-Prasinocladus_malaysianus.AAC.1